MTKGQTPGIVMIVKTVNTPCKTRVHTTSGVTRHLYLVPERQAQRKSYVPVGRALHLVDVENLMGGPEAGIVALHEALDNYRAAAHFLDGDHAIIGSNPSLGVQAKAAWPGARLVVKPGTDGADIALLEQVKDVDFIAARYDRIMIGSGDGVFEPMVRVFRSLGLPVGVVSRMRSLSADLRTSATYIQTIPEFRELEVTL